MGFGAEAFTKETRAPATRYLRKSICDPGMSWNYELNAHCKIIIVQLHSYPPNSMPIGYAHAMQSVFFYRLLFLLLFLSLSQSLFLFYFDAFKLNKNVLVSPSPFAFYIILMRTHFTAANRSAGSISWILSLTQSKSFISNSNWLYSLN